MLKSEAYNDLSYTAQALYTRCKLRRYGVKEEERPPGYDKDDKSTYTLFYMNRAYYRSFGMCEKTFINAMRQLVSHGFIDVVHIGGVTRGKSVFNLDCSQWRVWDKDKGCKLSQTAKEYLKDRPIRSVF